VKMGHSAQPREQGIFISARGTVFACHRRLRREW
jgi:hypothetical protein